MSVNQIASLRRNLDTIDFAHRLTGEEINHQVDRFIPDILDRVGLLKLSISNSTIKI